MLVVLAFAGILVVSGCVSDKVIDNEQKSSQSDGADSGDAESSGYGSSDRSSGAGNTIGYENDSAPIKGVRYVTPAVTNGNDLFKKIIMKPNSGQIVGGRSVTISIFKNDIGKLSINVSGVTLKNFRVEQTSDTTVIYAEINPPVNNMRFRGILLTKAGTMPSQEICAGQAERTINAIRGERILLTFQNEEWNRAKVLWLEISI